MPRIPTYDQSQTYTTDPGKEFSSGAEKARPLNIQYTPDTRWDTASKVINKIAGDMKAAENAEAESVSKAAIIRRTNELLFQSETEWKDLSIDDSLTKFNDEYSIIKNDVLDNVKDKKLKAKLNAQFDEYAARSETKVRTNAYNHLIDKTVASATENKLGYEQLAMTANNTDDFFYYSGLIADEVGRMKDVGAIDQNTANKMLLDSHNKMVTQSLVQLIDMDPSTAWPLLNGDPEQMKKYDVSGIHNLYQTLGAEEKTKILHYAEEQYNGWQKKEKITNYAARERFKQAKADDLSARLANGYSDYDIPTMADQVWADAPDKAEAEKIAYAKEQQLVNRKHSIGSQIKWSSAADLQNLMDSVDPTKNAGTKNKDNDLEVWQYANQVLAARNKALADDPVRYVVENTYFKDPDTQTILNEQKRMGVPPHKMRVLPNNFAKGFVESMKSSSGKEIVDQFDTLKNNYTDDQWNIAIRDFGRQKMPTALRIVADMDRETQQDIRIKMAEVYKLKEKDLLDSVAGIKGYDKEAIVKAVDMQINYGKGETPNIDDVRRALINSYGWTSEAMEEIHDLKDVLARTSYAYMLDGTNPTDAAKRVLNEVLNSKYEVSTDKNYLIPKKTGLNRKQVKAATDKWMENLTIDQLATTTPDGTKIYSNKMKRDLAVKAVKQGGHWVNHPRRDMGLMLVDVDNDVILGPDNKAIVMSWDQINEALRKTEVKEVPPEKLKTNKGIVESMTKTIEEF